MKLSTKFKGLQPGVRSTKKHHNSQDTSSCGNSSASTSPSTASTSPSTASTTPITLMDDDITDLWSNEALQQVAQLWNLTEAQVDLLRTLKDRLEDLDHWKNDPLEVVRYLNEFQWNLPKAERMVRKLVEWRLEHEMDTYVERFGAPHAIYHHLPIALLEGCDKDGDPIFLNRMGATDARGIFKAVGVEGVEVYSLFLLEMVTNQFVQQQLQQQGRRMTKMTMVVDMHGLSVRHFFPQLLPYLKRRARVSQDFYTGFFKRIIIVRAPAVFKWFYSMVSSFIDPEIQDIMQVTSHDGYLEVLDQYMDRAVLPPVICPQDGQGRTMPDNYFANVHLEGGSIPYEVAQTYDKEAQKHRNRIFARAMYNVKCSSEHHECGKQVTPDLIPIQEEVAIETTTSDSRSIPESKALDCRQIHANLLMKGSWRVTQTGHVACSVL